MKPLADHPNATATKKPFRITKVLMRGNELRLLEGVAASNGHWMVMHPFTVPPMDWRILYLRNVIDVFIGTNFHEVQAVGVVDCAGIVDLGKTKKMFEVGDGVYLDIDYARRLGFRAGEGYLVDPGKPAAMKHDRSVFCMALMTNEAKKEMMKGFKEERKEAREPAF